MSTFAHQFRKRIARSKKCMPMELSWPEQLICNQLVVGSNPSIGSFVNIDLFGKIPKRPTGADCKSAGLRLRRFESCSSHFFCLSGSSSVDRASAFQAEGRGFESRLPLKQADVAQG